VRLPDPFELARRQVAIDDERIADDAYRSRKQKKLCSSPLGFFRGSARLFYEVLAAERGLALDDGTSGPIVGDMHLENVGAYKTDGDELTFDLNDFDDATTGPHWLDTLRLSVSVLLAGRSFQASGPESLALASDLLSAYAIELGARETALSTPPLARAMAVKPIAELCERASRRTRKELLDMRAPFLAGQRRFARGDRYGDLSPFEAEHVGAVIDAYVAALGSRAPARAKTWRLLDAAHRVAGNGSLGRQRIAFLIVDATNTERLFELKEAVPSATDALLGPRPISEQGAVDPARRMFDAAVALVAEPPRQLAPIGQTALGFLCGRKLCPEEDKLDLARLHVGPKLSAVGRVVGEILARAHRRSATVAPSPTKDLLDRAVYLAGLFEAVYLAYARIAS
jgi:uncharacterized protein (DUF2252 family)